MVLYKRLIHRSRRQIMKPQAIGLIAVTMLLCGPVLIRSQGAPYPITTGKAYKFEKITDGVYYATAAGSMVTGSNNVVIFGSRDLMVVDTGTSPAAARAFIED